MLKGLSDLNLWKSWYDASDADHLLAIGEFRPLRRRDDGDVHGLLNLLASRGGGTAVPEPSSLMLIACGMTLCWCRQPKGIGALLFPAARLNIFPNPSFEVLRQLPEFLMVSIAISVAFSNASNRRVEVSVDAETIHCKA